MHPDLFLAHLTLKNESDTICIVLGLIIFVGFVSMEKWALTSSTINHILLVMLLFCNFTHSKYIHIHKVTTVEYVLLFMLTVVERKSVHHL